MFRLNLSFIKTTYYNDFPQGERERGKEREAEEAIYEAHLLTHFYFLRLIFLKRPVRRPQADLT